MKRNGIYKNPIYHKEGISPPDFGVASNIIVIFAPILFLELTLFWKKLMLWSGFISQYQRTLDSVAVLYPMIVIFLVLFSLFLYSHVKKNRDFILSHLFYMLGLCLPNVVFWNHPLAQTLKNAYAYPQAFDQATNLAILTNAFAGIFFVLRMKKSVPIFYEKYLNSLFNGKALDIHSRKKRLFSQISLELMSLLRQQFFISGAFYILFTVVFSKMGIARTVMKLYPMLAAAYFVVMFMYAEVLFLYYFRAFISAWKASLCFSICTLLGSIVAGYCNPVFYGAGLWLGALLTSIVLYRKLGWLEIHIEEQVFCRGSMLEASEEPKPDSKVFARGPK